MKQGTDAPEDMTTQDAAQATTRKQMHQAARYVSKERTHQILQANAQNAGQAHTTLQTDNQPAQTVLRDNTTQPKGTQDAIRVETGTTVLEDRTEQHAHQKQATVFHAMRLTEHARGVPQGTI